ncbi:hypothetical protein SAMN04515665_107138 [Blastococcus sp. DSM 46786]|uniref:hypothetical protein n=1 Tax=Blastococcus sp. DSM 46786 TaxID=1798227 RepID=UPI0008AF6199|nr:hypothetical protein [Blastococcus sp. DSM 46786]SEL02964.1 hypothetical protein SAMN04515665_107138 [Blastococcus sp. DSM 46786]
MSRSTPEPAGPAADARTALPESETAAFDRLAHAVLASPSAPLGALLRAQLPGTAGVRWLRQEGLPPTTRPAELTAERWLSLFRCWQSVSPAPGAAGTSTRRNDGRPATHGHAPGAAAIPRWGS